MARPTRDEFAQAFAQPAAAGADVDEELAGVLPAALPPDIRAIVRDYTSANAPLGDALRAQLTWIALVYKRMCATGWVQGDIETHGPDEGIALWRALNRNDIRRFIDELSALVTQLGPGKPALTAPEAEVRFRETARLVCEVPDQLVPKVRAAAQRIGHFDPFPFRGDVDSAELSSLLSHLLLGLSRPFGADIHFAFGPRANVSQLPLTVEQGGLLHDIAHDFISRSQHDLNANGLASAVCELYPRLSLAGALVRITAPDMLERLRRQHLRGHAFSSIRVGAIGPDPYGMALLSIKHHLNAQAGLREVTLGVAPESFGSVVDATGLTGIETLWVEAPSRRKLTIVATSLNAPFKVRAASPGMEVWVSREGRECSFRKIYTEVEGPDRSSRGCVLS